MQQSRELLEAKNEIFRLRAQMQRPEEVGDLLNISRTVLYQRVRVKHRFMLDRRHEFSISLMCRVIRVDWAGFYQWLYQPEPERTMEGLRLLELIGQSYEASNGVYVARRIFGGLREAGEVCGKHRVERIMRVNKIKTVRCSKAPPTHCRAPVH